MQALRIFENPETTSPLVQKLLAHWGGGSVLLGTGDGNLAILVSASAQPLRPWALGAAGGAGPAEEFLPGQLLLRRGESSWVARLTEGLHVLSSSELSCKPKWQGAKPCPNSC